MNGTPARVVAGRPRSTPGVGHATASDGSAGTDDDPGSTWYGGGDPRSTETARSAAPQCPRNAPTSVTTARDQPVPVHTERSETTRSNLTIHNHNER